LKNDKKKKFFYKFFSKQTSIEIIEGAIKKNNSIELDSKAKAFMGYK